MLTLKSSDSEEPRPHEAFDAHIWSRHSLSCASCKTSPEIVCWRTKEMLLFRDGTCAAEPHGRLVDLPFAHLADAVRRWPSESATAPRFNGQIFQRDPMSCPRVAPDLNSEAADMASGHPA